MSEFRNSKTALNLMKAFAGESQARSRYTYYAGVAKKQGYLQIANIFLETAENELQHAKVFHKKLVEKGLDGEVINLQDTGYPVALSQETLKNLEYAAGGENEEWTVIYPEFAKIAETEGHPDIAFLFRLIASVEAKHEARYEKLAQNIKEGKVFKRDEVQAWKCLNCGFVAEKNEAPHICPACAHPQMYFELVNLNY